MKFPALAVTDHGVLYGAIDFYEAASQAGIKPIIGCEVYVAPGSRTERKTSAGGRDAYHHLVLLAKDEVGYKNLIQLTTKAHLEGYYYKPRIDKELLALHKEGLIALSGCLASEIPEWIQKDQLHRARETIDWFKQTLGPENFYLELQNHGLPEQAKVNRHLIAWAKEFGLKLVATNDVHYIEKGHSHAHDCLICIGTQTQLTDTKRMKYADAAVLPALGGGDAGALCRGARGGAEHAGGGREVQPGDRVRQAALPGVPSAGALHARRLPAAPAGRRVAQALWHPSPGPMEHDFVVEAVEDREEAADVREVQSPKSEGPKCAARRPPKLLLRTCSTQHAARTRHARTSPIRPSPRPSRASWTGWQLELQGHREDRVHQLLPDRRATSSATAIERGIACVARGSAAGSIVTYLLGISNV